MGNTCFKARVGVANRNICLLIVGLDNAGKTCTAKSIVGESLDNVAPTVGFSRAEHKYKGYQVTIYDLGGSKSFRGIWNKYYDEVHGLIFVVDSSDSTRIDECRAVLKEMLENSLVQGKPILLLCNKSDIDQAQDEVELVSKLDVEALVNAAQCPTRVEASNASRGQGLKEGYKWLVKSVIANYLELEARVKKDTDASRQQEELRRAEARKRIEERSRLEQEETANSIHNVGDGDAEVEPPGFVPMDELRQRWTNQPDKVSMRVNVSADSLDTSSVQNESERVQNKLNGLHELTQLRVSDLPHNGFSNGKLELEPIHRPKKKSLLSKINKSNTEISTIDNQVSKLNGERTSEGSGYSNWGLA